MWSEMRRREFITLIGGTAAAWPLATRGQLATKTYFVLWVSTEAQPDPFIAGFLEGMRERSYVEGQNLALVLRYAPGDPARLRAMLPELLSVSADLIVSSGPAILAMRAATRKPVLFAISGDPVELGIADSLARPGKNFTGTTFMSLQDASEKRVGQLVEACCHRPVVLDLIEEALNEVALAVECEVAVADFFSVGLRRNDRRDVARFEPLEERVGVVALVSNHGVGREVFEQRLGLRYIVNLPGRERERDWIAERIDGGVDFRRQSTTRRCIHAPRRIGGEKYGATESNTSVIMVECNQVDYNQFGSCHLAALSSSVIGRRRLIL